MKVGGGGVGWESGWSRKGKKGEKEKERKEKIIIIKM